MIALIDVENDDHAAPESLTDAEIIPGDPCAKFEDDSLLVWQRWVSGGTGQALFYFDLYFHDTRTTWKRCAQCEHRTHEYGGEFTIHPVGAFQGYFQKTKVRLDQVR